MLKRTLQQVARHARILTVCSLVVALGATIALEPRLAVMASALAVVMALVLWGATSISDRGLTGRLAIAFLLRAGAVGCMRIAAYTAASAALITAIGSVTIVWHTDGLPLGFLTGLALAPALSAAAAAFFWRLGGQVDLEVSSA